MQTRANDVRTTHQYVNSNSSLSGFTSVSKLATKTDAAICVAACCV